MVGKRRAIVGDEPGITRDRLYGEAEWSGRALRVVDTGGILPGAKDEIPAEIFKQARVALEEAAAIVLVVDGRSEIAAPDLELARLLRRAGKPLFLAVNKIDTQKQEALAHEFHRLGIAGLFPVSAEHGTGVGELMEAVLDAVPSGEAPAAEASEASEVRVAIIGRPNVGKSTLLNRLTGGERAIVSPMPGTTRDAVDEAAEHNGRRYRFIDTAGIRRKGKTHLMAEKLSVVMARKHLESADVALMMLDAVEGVTALDANIAGYAHESGRSIVLLVNKWDLVGPGRPDGKPPADRNRYEQQIRRAFKFLPYAPVLFISAQEGRSTERIFTLLERVVEERSKRISTGEMNRFLKRVDMERASAPAGRKVRIYYMTQASTAPPTFVLFTDRKTKMHFAQERFLENQIRRAFGFEGTPIRILNRARE